MPKEAIINATMIATNCWICDFFMGQFYGLNSMANLPNIWGNQPLICKGELSGVEMNGFFCGLIEEAVSGGKR